jgi:uncharacterized protein YqeY
MRKAIGKHTRGATRYSRSFTIDSSILDYLQRTCSHRSRSDRVNELLQRAIRQEEYEALEREAAEFYSKAVKQEQAESRAFAQASRETLAREEE